MCIRYSCPHLLIHVRIHFNHTQFHTRSRLNQIEDFVYNTLLWEEKLDTPTYKLHQDYFYVQYPTWTSSRTLCSPSIISNSHHSFFFQFRHDPNFYTQLHSQWVQVKRLPLYVDNMHLQKADYKVVETDLQNIIFSMDLYWPIQEF